MEFAKAKNIPVGSKSEIRNHLKMKFLHAQHELLEGQQNPIVEDCKELYDLVQRVCGLQISDYLGRSVTTFKNFGQRFEGTDGLHLVALMQREVPVLHPAAFRKDSPGEMHVCFSKDAVQNGGSVLWAAKGVNASLTLQWMERALKMPALVVGAKARAPRLM